MMKRLQSVIQEPFLQDYLIDTSFICFQGIYPVIKTYSAKSHSKGHRIYIMSTKPTIQTHLLSQVPPVMIDI